MKRFLAVFLMMVSWAPARAAESDHFTLPEGRIADITAEVNKLSNEGLAAAIDDLNAQGGCDGSKDSEERLYDRLTDVFSNHKKGQLVQAIIAGDLPRTVIPLKESVYSEWSIWNGFLLGRRSASKSLLALFPLVKIGDTVVGADKLEHMFGQGLIYFKGYYLNERPLINVLKGGVFREKTFLGGNVLATGVFSYGDLSADFNGMRFWNHMLQKRDDVLGAKYNAGPYLFCRDGKWVKNEERPIDFRTYIDATMQESENCSKFATAAGARRFRAALAAMQKRDKTRTFACPENPALLDAAAEKYKVEVPGDSHGSTIEHWIINREGNTKVSFFNEF